MTSGEIKRVIIIGAGQGGGETAQRLRQGGFTGEITLIGEEPVEPGDNGDAESPGGE